MKELKRILVMTRFKEHHLKQLKDQFKDIEFIYENHPTQELIDSVDGIIGNPKTSLDLTKIKFLQLGSAGSDGYVGEGILSKEVTLMNASGAYGVNISEHMLAFVLYFYKHFDKYLAFQKEGNWKSALTAREIMDSRVLVVGVGDLGGEFAKRMKALGSYVSGIKRTISNKVPYVDELHTLDDLDGELEKADIVALCLPQSNETRHLFDKERLLKMKKDALLINVGRGSAIKTEDLMEVLDLGHLMGVGLDVVEEEPLDKDHPLWYYDRVFITPHISGGLGLERNKQFLIDLTIRNINHYLNEEQVENEVNFKTGYRYR